MTELLTRRLNELQLEHDTLSAQGEALLATVETQLDPKLDPETSEFMGDYLSVLRQDFSEALETEGCSGEGVLELVVGELHDLVAEVQRRVEPEVAPSWG